MSNIQTELTRLLTLLLVGVDVTLIHQKQELDYLLYCAAKCENALVLHCFSSKQPLFVSNTILSWLAIGQHASTYGLMDSLTQSDCEKELGCYVAHFIKSPADDLCNTYHFRKINGTPLLLYGCSRCISFDEAGNAGLIITLLCPVDYAFGLCHQPGEAIDPTLSDDSRQRFNTLTPRQKELLPLMMKGMSNNEIAAQKNISSGTVRVHRNTIKHNLGLERL